MCRRPLVDPACFANDLAQFPVFHVDWRKKRARFDPRGAAARGSGDQALVVRGCSAGVCLDDGLSWRRWSWKGRFGWKKHLGIWICWSGEVLGGVEHSRGSRKRQQGVDVGHEAGNGGLRFLFVQRTFCRTFRANLAVGDLGVHSGSPRLMQKDGASRFCSDSPLGSKNFQASRPWFPARSLPLMQQVAIQTLQHSVAFLPRRWYYVAVNIFPAVLAPGVELGPLIPLQDGLLATKRRHPYKPRALVRRGSRFHDQQTTVPTGCSLKYKLLPCPSLVPAANPSTARQTPT